MQDAILSALQPYRLKPAGRDNYRCNSPLRPGSNSHAFAVTIDPTAPGGGVWYDHVAEEGGDFVDLAQRLGLAVDTPAAAPAPAAPRAYQGLDDYAQAHGVPPAVLRAAGWKESTWSRDRIPALEFPTPNGPRFRLIDGGDTKYIQPAGYKACLFGLDRAIELAAETGQPLVICNGEVSTIVAQHYGVAAFAQNMGEKKLTDEHLDQLQAAYPAGALLVTLDCDEKGRRVAGEIRAQLSMASYSVRAVDLGGAQGFDLANFAQLYQEATAAALLALQELPQPQGDISLYLREMERLRQENERLRGQVSAYKAREVWQYKILTREDLRPNEKGLLIGLEPVLRMRRDMGSQREDHTGSVPATYRRLGKLVKTSPSTVGRVIQIGEQLELWRRDPELKHIKSDSGEDIEVQLMRLDLLPAFDDPDLAEQLERKQHGGARPGAGRKPSCPKCPPDTAVVVRTVKRIETRCLGCGDILHVETIPLSAEVIEAEIQDETEMEIAGTATEIQDETEKDIPSSVSSCTVPIPPIIEDTIDLGAAIHCADAYCPAEIAGHNAYKTAMFLIWRNDPAKALAQLKNIHDPQARAIVKHLAARAQQQAAPT